MGRRKSMKEIIWIDKTNTRFEQASLTWLAYQFSEFELGNKNNPMSQRNCAFLFKTTESSVRKIWKRLFLN
jgi:hypothetical protein